jgi:hypothetical protein
MMVNRHKYFRWTKRTAWITFAYVVIVPTMLGTAGYMTEVSGDRFREHMQGIGEFGLMEDTGQVGDAWEAKGRYHLGVLGRCERGKWNVYMDREERIVSRASHGRN